MPIQLSRRIYLGDSLTRRRRTGDGIPSHRMGALPFFRTLLDVYFCLDDLEWALGKGTPEIFNTDQSLP